MLAVLWITVLFVLCITVHIVQLVDSVLLSKFYKICEFYLKMKNLLYFFNIEEDIIRVVLFSSFSCVRR